MNLHQPQEMVPERMLWTCDLCGAWFLMDLARGGSEAILVRLPARDFFRSAMER
jgi:hypothetical protein